MLHVLKMIRRRYPEKATGIIATLAAVSGSVLLIGVGLLLR